MKLYFISDQHLSDVKEEKCQALLRFFRSIQSPADCAHLFLLGDIFDLWLGKHRFFIEKWFDFNSELLRLKNCGVEIHYFEGNHDLYLKDYFENQLGFHVYYEAAYLEIGGKTFRIEHGDQMDPEDKGYLFLRWFLRTPFMNFVGRKFPSAFVKWLGEWASGKSRHYTSEIKTTTQERTQHVIMKHAARAYEEKPFNILVAGHVHQKEDRVLQTKNGGRARILNLGFQEEPLLIEV